MPLKKMAMSATQQEEFHLLLLPGTVSTQVRLYHLYIMYEPGWRQSPCTTRLYTLQLATYERPRACSQNSRCQSQAQALWCLSQLWYDLLVQKAVNV